MKNKTLGKMLQQRGMNFDKVAEQIMTNRQAMTRVLLGKSSGGPTWKKLDRVLSVEEMRCARDYAEQARLVVGVQRALRDAGRYQGRLSGELDRATKDALKIWQQENALEVNGLIDEQTLMKLAPKMKDAPVKVGRE